MSIVPMKEEPATFNYDVLDDETREFVRQRTAELKTLVATNAARIVAIGKLLTEVRSRLSLHGHGTWEKWLRSEFGWPRRTAYDYIDIAKAFGDMDMTRIEAMPTALKLVSLPGLPDEVRQDAKDALKETVRTGSTFTVPLARELVRPYAPEVAENAFRAGNRGKAGGPRKHIMGKEATFLARQASAKVAETVAFKDRVQRAVRNLQMALAECYGVPLRTPVREALSELQALVEDKSNGNLGDRSGGGDYTPDAEWMNAPLGPYPQEPQA